MRKINVIQMGQKLMDWQMEYFITESGSCPVMKYHKGSV